MLEVEQQSVWKKLQYVLHSSLGIILWKGVPIKFVGVGEELEQLDLFNPKNIASRILGSGDLATLAERAMHIAAAQGMEEMAAQAEECNSFFFKKTYYY